MQAKQHHLACEEKEQQKNMFWWIVLGGFLFLIAINPAGILLFGNIPCPLRGRICRATEVSPEGV